MSGIDLTLLIFLLFFAYRGFSNGLIISLTTLIGLILGFYAASHFSEFTAGWLKNDLGLKSDNLRLIAYIVTFVLVVVLIFFLGKFLTGVVKTVGLGVVNRLAGAAFGIAKGMLIASLLFLLLARIDSNQSLLTPALKKASLLYKPVASVAPAILPLIKKYTEEAEDLLEGKSK
jgi:membrane protein required for colicin V production